MKWNILTKFIRRSFLRKFPFDYLVVDEGHTLKNPKGLRYQNLNKFQTRSRLLLTGKRKIIT
jgi:SNF2 family DNA or RNA helicase